MALTPKLEFRQSQSLVLTPQLQQAIKLLQLSNIELGAFVAQEMEKNPFLERDDGSGDDRRDGDAGDREEQNTDPIPNVDTESPVEITPTSDASLAEDASLPTSDNAPLDIDERSLYGDDDNASGPVREPETNDAGMEGWTGVPSSGGSFDGGENSIEQSLGGAVTLKDHLLEQLNITFPDPIERLIGVHLIDLVDDAGYLQGELEVVADRLGCTHSKVVNVLFQMQIFDPPGVLAQNLAECLAIQQRILDRLDPAMKTFLEHLDLLAKRDLNGLRKACDVDLEDLTDMIHEIQALNPKPGLAFGSEIVQPVVPDVFVREKSHGGWTVELNSETLPRVLVNSRYYSQIASAGATRAEKTYFSESLSSANWLVKSLDQRARTILKVSSEIVIQQEPFFTHGVEHLRPLNLKAIAEAIEMHESTVSRVTANKYMATPRGIFELKYFFTSAISSSQGGEDHSAESVRFKIKTLIDAESVTAVLSDDKIVELLRDSGVEIARRTVAKYREAMKIPSSIQRRRLKKSFV
jgi:RNA polymerase sigma-54 factor